MNLQDLTEVELIKLNSATIDELRRRNVVRTRNSPIGDFAEWLVSRSLGLNLEENSKAGFDAISDDGIKYQVKARIVTKKNNSRQMSVIRNYESEDFDYLLAIIFNEDIEILEAKLLPHHVVGKYARYREHQNGHILILKGPVLQDSEVKDMREVLTANNQINQGLG